MENLQKEIVFLLLSAVSIHLVSSYDFNDSILDHGREMENLDPESTPSLSCFMTALSATCHQPMVDHLVLVLPPSGSTQARVHVCYFF